MQPPNIELDLAYHFDLPAFGLRNTPDGRFEQAAQWIAEQFELRRLYRSLAIVDDTTMREQVNAQRLGHDWPTDVISFELDASNESVEGEVIASVQRQHCRTCVAAGWSVGDELLLYVVHGLLHVVGLDDIDEQARQQMRAMEQACLLAVGVEQASQHLARWDAIAHSEADE